MEVKPNQIWSTEAYILHNEAMRTADEKYHAERDRRYTEVKVEAEKAIKVKETADLAALTLARESQLYKDQQADIMREKNLSSSGIYATNADLAKVVEKMEQTLKPIIEFVNGQQGVDKGTSLTKGNLISIITTSATIITIVFLIVNNVL